MVHLNSPYLSNLMSYFYFFVNSAPATLAAQVCWVLFHFKALHLLFPLLGILLSRVVWFASSRHSGLCSRVNFSINSSMTILLNWNSHYYPLLPRLLIPFLSFFFCRIYYHLTLGIFFLIYANIKIIMFIALEKKVHVNRKFEFL